MPPTPRRPGLLRQVGRVAAWLGVVSVTNTRVEIDALSQYGREEIGPQAVLDRIPGWIVVVGVVAAFLLGLLYWFWPG